MLSYGKIYKIDCASREFPQKLRNIADPPKQLYCAGDIGLLHKKSIGVVGSRKFTIYGKSVAEMVGRRFAESGIPVVSGLAIGIDGYAHQGVVNGHGQGIGVLGSGHLKMTPMKNQKLMYEMLDEGGLVVSEYEPDCKATYYSYPRRNRIISGLSEALIVIEANYNSGALITAQFANEQGKTVYAVPGNINSQFSIGSNLLIRDGAIPMIVVDDVIRDLGYEVKPENERKPDLGSDEIAVINEIEKYNGVTPDVIAAALNKKISQINAIATVLEIKGVIEIYGGKIFLAKGR